MRSRAGAVRPAPAAAAVLLLLVLLVPAVLLLPVVGSALPGAASSVAQTFPPLQADQRVYDETGDSLSTAQAADLEQRLDALQQQTGADAVAVVRDLDATPEETLEQVEALQQAWVLETGTDEGTAVAFLVDRNPGDDPGDDTDARAGVYVGRTFEEGNVPRGEQEEIVAEALIPPLRDGDVAASLTAGVERLSSSIQDGPPQSPTERWAAAAGSTWVPWTGLGLAVAGGVVVLVLYRRRASAGTPEPTPTTTRPGDLPPAVAGALVAGAPQLSAVPAVVLDLAARGALDVEQEKEPGRFSGGSVRLRLLDQGLVRDDVERAVWDALDERAEGGVVPSSGLRRVAQGGGDVREAVRGRLRDEGWWDTSSSGLRVGLAVVAVVAVLLMTFGVVVAAVGEVLLALVAVASLGALALTAFVLAVTYPRLSAAGQEAAVPWKGYREGLEAAGKDDGAPAERVDLDAVLPDVVALNLGSVWKDRLEEATEAGALRAFTASGSSTAATSAVIFPWGAFAGVFATSSGGAAAASGAGAGGGGGAAGST